MVLKHSLKAATAIAIMVSLSACAGMNERLSRVNRPPPQSFANPSTIPMPAQNMEIKQGNSLWSSQRTTFFKDQRARTVGDILTVMVEIDDKAELENSTTRTRSGNESASVGALAGFENVIAGKILPNGNDLSNLGQFGSTTDSSGDGQVDREEKIELVLAAIVADVLPNGNMVIKGQQEVRVNFENRILTLTGIIRPEDISINNSISYDKIAEARISYGGTGQITDVQQPRYGQQIYEAIFPF